MPPKHNKISFNILSVLDFTRQTISYKGGITI